MELLENFRAADTDLVFVVDEYGAVQGVITERDLLEAITGEFGAPTDEDAWAVQREGGGWLMDGLIPVPELKDRLELKELPEEDRGRYNTLAGMIMLLLGRLPRTADAVVWEGWRFEVVDLDGKRVDKVWSPGPNPLEKKLDQSEPAPPARRPGQRLAPQAQAQGAHHRLVAGQQLNAIFLAAAEFGDACKEFPIVFVKAGKEADGATPSRPLPCWAWPTTTCTCSGQWRAQYMPASCACTPSASRASTKSALPSAWTWAFRASARPKASRSSWLTGSRPNC
jgi:hypothetical protein